MADKVLLGFSGGVDSSCAALILKNEGYEVHGLYFDVLEKGDEETRLRAEKTAEILGVEFKAINVSKRFEKAVIEPFCHLYACGKTPNPCIICNPQLKFAVLTEEADNIGAKYIATGHYAKVERINNYYYVNKAANADKDQSYMLCRLGQDVLSRLILPLGTFVSKDEIRAMAKEYELPTAQTKDSQDICFLQDCDYKSFLKSRGIDPKPGNFTDKNGNVYARHNGHYAYTIGQGKHLGIALGKHVYVTEIRENGDVVLGGDEDLFKKNVRIENVKYHGLDAVKGGRFTAKLRYSRNGSGCFLEPLDNNSALLMFEEGQRAPTPGQEAVVYKGDRVVACGTIRI